MSTKPLELSPDRFFAAEPSQRKAAREIYERIANLPIVSPHGHVDPKLFSEPNASFGSPADLLIIPDHYVFRMLYSQGISLDSVGVPRRDGKPVESDHRKIWDIFARNFYLFRGTPSGIWLTHELQTVFGIREQLNADSSMRIYDEIDEKLHQPEYSPRKLFEKFNIEVLCTTDAASDSLNDHKKIAASGWKGRVIPTFRPDGVVNLDAPNWKGNIQALSAASGIDVHDVPSLVKALEHQRAYFKSMGARATDHAALSAYTNKLSPAAADAIFQRAMKEEATADDATAFTGHMLMEMARMSIEDGLTMQVHTGALRNHNASLFESNGLDKGADIPVQVEFTRNMRPLLNKYANDPRLTLILFTLDETVYAREMATLSGHYPAVKIGPPWWFHDSLNGMARYFDQVMETAGIYNTVGFIDDTRAFPSIPARHDLWRRSSANWLGGMVVRGIIGMDDAHEMAQAMTYDLPKQAYKL